MIIYLSPYQHSSINTNGSVIKSSNSENLLGITINSGSTFEEHINTLAKNCIYYLEFHNIYHNTKSQFYSKLLMSQLNYCPLVWMCHIKGLSNKINNLHKRTLRTVYQERKIETAGFTAEGQICLYQHEKLKIFSYRNL